MYEGSQACDAEGGSNPHVQGEMTVEVEPDTALWTWKGHNWTGQVDVSWKLKWK